MEIVAKTSNGLPSKRQTISVNGLMRPAGPVKDYTIRVAGLDRTWKGLGQSQNTLTYLAAIEAMITAHAAAVTHLTLQTPNDDVRRTATGEWECKSLDMAHARALYMLFKFDFDDVDWQRGPA